MYDTPTEHCHDASVNGGGTGESGGSGDTGASGDGGDDKTVEGEDMSGVRYSAHETGEGEEREIIEHYMITLWTVLLEDI